MVGLHQILAGNVITCLEPQLNCQCRFFLGLRLTVTDQNRYRNKTYKTLKMTKDVGMAYQKVCKQGRRDDIIAKVNSQSPIPKSFYITVAN